MQIQVGQKDKKGNEIVKITRSCFYAKASAKILKGLQLQVMTGDWSIDSDGNWLIRFNKRLDAKLFN